MSQHPILYVTEVFPSFVPNGAMSLRAFSISTMYVIDILGRRSEKAVLLRDRQGAKGLII